MSASNTNPVNSTGLSPALPEESKSESCISTQVVSEVAR